MSDEATFDVFLSHNSKDKPAVRNIACALVARGIDVWLDEWELIPGQDWQEGLQDMIKTIKSAAILIGRDGLGPWEIREMRACLKQFVDRNMPVIPVLLPGAPGKPELPLFLTSLTWVDFPKSGLTEKHLDRLIWGITGTRPDSIRRLEPETATEPSIEGKTAGRTFLDLKSHLEFASVRDEVVRFGAEFRAVRDLVGKLGNYKDLHDHLQEIEFRCHNLVAPQAKRSDADKIDWDLLSDAELTLQHLVGLLRDVRKRCCLSSQETTWVDILGNAREDLQLAIEQQSPRLLKQASLQIGRTLTIQLSQINTKLNAVASDLRLSVLVERMNNIAETSPALNGSDVPTPLFKQGIKALVRLHQTLKSLVAQHYDWQLIDQELNLIAANIERDERELEIAWPDLNRRVEALYDTVTAEWVVSIRKDKKKLDQVIGDPNSSKVREHFRRYRRQVSNRFYRVDHQLKDLCENLRQIDGPLGSLLGAIE